MKVKFIFPDRDISIIGDLNEKLATVQRLKESLPVQSRGNRWGKEFYFSCPLEAEEENSRQILQLGEIGFWIPGKALCLFFGPTPISQEGEIRAASQVNVIGKLEGDLSVLESLEDGDRVVVEEA
ncbi:MAG: hypothetical protein GXO71_07095 [Caldiserica bacterium]|nr:hypothetical protein [Caldisericota bacterium]